MTLIDHAQATLFFAEPHDSTLIWIDSVAVGFSRVRGLGKSVAEGSENLSVATIGEQRLQSVVVGPAQIHQHAYLTHAAICGKNRA